MSILGSWKSNSGRFRLYGDGSVALVADRPFLYTAAGSQELTTDLLEQMLGLIAPGLRADLVHFDADFCVQNTWVAGQLLCHPAD